MARPKSPTLTEAELRLMDVLWKKETATVSDVVGALPATAPLRLQHGADNAQDSRTEGLRVPRKGGQGLCLPAGCRPRGSQKKRRPVHDEPVSSTIRPKR